MDLVVALGALVACRGVPDEAGPPVLPGAEEPPCALESRFYRIDELTLPRTIEEVEQSGLNLDSPSDAEVGITVETDNQLGALVVDLLDRFGLDPAPALQAALDGRSLLWILELQDCVRPGDGNAARMTLHMSLGSSIDPLTGTETVTLAPGSVTGVPAQGSRVGRQVSVERGTGLAPASVLAEIDGSEPILWARSSSLTARFDEQADGGLSGLIGVGLDMTLAYLAIAPVLARSLNQLVADDPGCPLACSSEQTSAILEQLDTNGDGTVTTAEIGMDAILTSHLSADLDLVAEHNGQAVYWPNHDRKVDHVSLGLRFHAVPVEVGSVVPSPLPRVQRSGPSGRAD